MVLAPGRQGPKLEGCSAGEESFPALEVPGTQEWPAK